MSRWIFSGFADEYAPDLGSQIEGFQKLGISYMEPRVIDGKNIADFTDEQAQALALRLKEGGISVKAIGSPIGKAHPEEDFEAHLQRAEQAFRNAKILGADYCRVFSFYGLSEEETFSRMERLISLAEQYGIMLCHENEAKIYGESPENCARLLRRFEGRLKAVFDMGNFVLGGYDPMEAFRLLKNDIAYFHIKDAADGIILPAGEGAGKISEILSCYQKEFGGEILLTLEPHLFDFGSLKGLAPSKLRRLHAFSTEREAFEAGASALFRLPFLAGEKDCLSYKVFGDREWMGHAAALEIADRLRSLLMEKEEVNVIFAAAPSQNETLAHLCAQPNIDWARVNAFHMDEYIGLSKDAPQCFSNFLKAAIFQKVPFKNVFTLDPSSAPAEEIVRYSTLLEAYPVDIVCMGIGENGHIAFNDPGVAKFDDPALVKRAKLDEICRLQQVHDGCFSSIEEVPKEALTLTVPALMAGKYLFCMVPAATKRAAVERMLSGKIEEACPCTILRDHQNAILYCDRDSFGL